MKTLRITTIIVIVTHITVAWLVLLRYHHQNHRIPSVCGDLNEDTFTSLIDVTGYFWPATGASDCDRAIYKSLQEKAWISYAAHLTSYQQEVDRPYRQWLLPEEVIAVYYRARQRVIEQEIHTVRAKQYNEIEQVLIQEYMATNAKSIIRKTLDAVDHQVYGQETNNQVQSIRQQTMK